MIDFGLKVSSISTNFGMESLTPLFNIKIPKIISNDYALVSGVIFGLLFGIYKNNIAIKLVRKFEKFTKLFFKILVPIMPFFILGTALKLQHDGVLTSICKQYLPILCFFVIVAYGFVFIQFLVVSRFKLSKTMEYIKNLIPAMITAFGAMSSAAALPLSIKAAEKNLIEKNNAGIIVPSVVNIHLVGDCLFIPLIAILVMVSFGMEFPSFFQYILFSLHFVLAKFAVAAIPGGGVLIMIPIMQTYLGLSADMLALVTAVYMLFDPFITMCNVAGNGSLAIIFEKITNAVFRKKIS
jgi:Na+/H+-dicarboxylate symporter